jgi:hypothetical protein
MSYIYVCVWRRYCKCTTRENNSTAKLDYKKILSYIYSRLDRIDMEGRS